MSELLLEDTTKSLWREMWDRRVPQFVGSYLLVGVAVLQFADWVVNRYLISPHWVEFLLVGLICIFPSILLFIWTHGKPGPDDFTRTEKIFIPINLVVTVLILFLLFSNKSMGAVSETITIQDEEGNSVEKVVTKKEFRKTLGLFYFENISGEAKLDWMRAGVPYAVSFDLMQDHYFKAESTYFFQSTLSVNGFEGFEPVPLAVKMKIARESSQEFFVSGTVDRGEEEEIKVKWQLHQSNNGAIVAKSEQAGIDVLTMADEMTKELKRILELPTVHIQNTQDLPLAELLTKSPSAYEDFINGMNAINFENDIPEASRLLEASIEKDDLFIFSHLKLVSIYIGNSQYELGQSHLAKTIQYVSVLPESQQLRAKYFHYLLNQDFDKRLRLLEMWEEIYPEDVDVMYYFIHDYSLSGQIPKAAEYMRKIVKVEPTATNYLQGLEFMTNGLYYEEALEYCAKYEELEPENKGIVFRSKAKIYGLQGVFDKAKDFYERALLLEDRVSDRMELARLEVQSGQFEKGLTLFKAEIERSERPEDIANVHKSLFNYYVMRGQYGRAVEHIEKQWEAELNFNSPLGIAFNKLSSNYIYVNAGQESKALEILEDAKPDISGPMADAYAFGPVIYHLAKLEPDKAEQHFEAMNRFIERFGQASQFGIFAKGKLEFQQAKYETCIETFEEFFTIFLSGFKSYDLLFVSESYVYAGLSYEKLGQMKEAETHFAKAIDVFEYDGNANFQMGRLLIKQGRQEEGMKHLKIAQNTWSQALEFDPFVKDFKTYIETLEL